VLEAIETLLHPTACPGEEAAAVRYVKGMIRLKIRKVHARNRAAELREVHTVMEPDSAYRAAAAITQTRDVQQALADLPACACDTNTRYWIHGDTAREIATDQGHALSTVKNQVARARPKLRSALRRHATDGHGAGPGD
jgi:DNA-directed RNA polymerase specialized sigma24 family protein